MSTYDPVLLRDHCLRWDEYTALDLTKPVIVDQDGEWYLWERPAIPQSPWPPDTVHIQLVLKPHHINP